jgi:hypothetical protein
MASGKCRRPVVEQAEQPPHALLRQVLDDNFGERRRGLTVSFADGLHAVHEMHRQVGLPPKRQHVVVEFGRARCGDRNLLRPRPRQPPEAPDVRYLFYTYSARCATTNCAPDTQA